MSAAEALQVDEIVEDRPPLIPPRRIKAAYAIGQVAYSGGFEAAFGFIFFYYTAVLGLEGSLVGLALAVSLAFDAVVDPLVGSLSDGLRGRMGRRLPVMIVAVPLIAVSMALLFAPLGRLTTWGLFAWLAASATATRAAISLFSVPHAALGAEMTEDYVERSRVVAWRTLVGILSHVTILTVAYSLFFTAARGGLQHKGGYPPLGIFVALFIAVGAGLCCVGMRRYAASLPSPRETAGSMLRRLPGEMAEIFSNRSFRVLFASAVGFYVAVGANAALGAHVNVYVWRLTPLMLQLLGYAVLGGVLAGVPMATPLQGVVGKKALVIAGICMLLVAWTVMPILRATGIVEAYGSAVFWPLFAQSVFAGIGIGFAVVAFPSMMADAADEHEYLFGHRREGLYFAGLGFAGKAATGLGTLIGGIAIEAIGFPRDPAAHPALAHSEPILRKLVLGWGPLPALVFFASLGFLSLYRVDRGRHDEIRAALAARGD